MNIFEDLLQTKLKTPVGDNQSSKPDDVMNTRKKLNALGLEAGDETHGFIDRDLDKSIRQFQTATDLKQDGLINPDGETERALNEILSIAQNNPPLPRRKPLTKQQKLKKIIKKGKEVQEEVSPFKYLLDLIKKRNPVGFMKELSEKAMEIHDKDKNGQL